MNEFIQKYELKTWAESVDMSMEAAQQQKSGFRDV